MRLPGALKDGSGKITKPGDMLIFPAGFSPIYGSQILYFLDSEFLKRAQIVAPEKSDTISLIDQKESIESDELPDLNDLVVDEVTGE